MITYAGFKPFKTIKFILSCSILYYFCAKLDIKSHIMMFDFTLEMLY